MNLLKEKGVLDKVVVAGGFIPEEEDRRKLETMGVKKVFQQDTPIAEIVKSIEGVVDKGAA